MKKILIFICILFSSCLTMTSPGERSLPKDLFKKMVREDNSKYDDLNDYLLYMYTGPFPENYTLFMTSEGFKPWLYRADLSDAVKRIENTKENRAMLYRLVVNEENTSKRIKYNNQYSYLWFDYTCDTYILEANRKEKLTEELIELAKKYGKTDIAYRWLRWALKQESMQSEKYKLLEAYETMNYKDQYRRRSYGESFD